MSEQAKLIPNLLLILFAALLGYLSKLRLASILFYSKTRKTVRIPQLYLLHGYSVGAIAQCVIIPIGDNGASQ
ncbi:hypothetical protein E5S67_02519 [Microcoleus sp. IPMA8]|uniref:Uncharacterized protein n=1 Tax=Microcoleus asticus IPMA8 TaxID=2563858 RepID=A0ABX2CZC5_9CYAN|nr:hypothetical protein [Microcoleus asticus IPMA8]